ncbi:MAG: tetratricopeptide repeat protein [Methanoregula sp.]|nr:tetratricopeptide repeat protein [Methanoregula sp.]
MQGDFESGYHHGLHLLQTKCYPEAIAAFKKVLGIQPGSSEAHHYLGRSFLAEGMVKEAQAEFREAIRLHPEDGKTGYWLALALLKSNRCEEARAELAEAIRRSPRELPHIYRELQDLFEQKCSPSQTGDFLKQCIRVFEERMPSGDREKDLAGALGSAYHALGEMYREKGLLNEAVIQYREAIRIQPENPAYHGKLAGIYSITNLVREAISEYRAALQHNPQDAAMHKELADALVKTGEFLDAFHEYREAVRLAPDNQNYANVYTQFRQLLVRMELGDADLGSLQSPGPSHPSRSLSPDIHFQKIIAEGENELVEYKASALWSKYLSKEEIDASESKEVHKYGRDASKFLIAKTIAGFLNTSGGDLIIGIRENKEGTGNAIIGIEIDLPKLKDPCTDGYRRMIIDEIIRKYLPREIFHQLNEYIRIHFPRYQDKTLCWIGIRKADSEIFLKVQDEEHFFIRVDAETRQIADKALVDYCRRHFP